jgi:hypothetical protein
LSVKRIEDSGGRARRLVGTGLALMLREYAVDTGLFAARGVAIAVPRLATSETFLIAPVFGLTILAMVWAV